MLSFHYSVLVGYSLVAETLVITDDEAAWGLSIGATFTGRGRCA